MPHSHSWLAGRQACGVGVASSEQHLKSLRKYRLVLETLGMTWAGAAAVWDRGTTITYIHEVSGSQNV